MHVVDVIHVSLASRHCCYGLVTLQQSPGDVEASLRTNSKATDTYLATDQLYNPSIQTRSVSKAAAAAALLCKQAIVCENIQRRTGQ
jgi:hypothetical protein